MLSRAIIKYTWTGLLHRRSNRIFLLVLMIGWFIFIATDDAYLKNQLEMLQLGTFINLFIILTISGGIIGDERKRGYFDLLFAKPIRKDVFYLSKIAGTWIVGLGALVIVWISIGLYALAVKPDNFQASTFLAFLLSFAMTQLSVLVLSAFFLQFLKGQSNITAVFFFVLLGSLTVKYWVGSSPLVQLLKSLIVPYKGTMIYDLLIGGQTAGSASLLAVLGLVIFLLVFLGGGAFLFEKLDR